MILPFRKLPISFCIIIFYFVLNTTLSMLNSDIIVRYSQEKEVTHGTILSCATKREKMDISKTLMSFDLQYLFIDIKRASFDYERALQRIQYKHMGIVLDGDCEYISNVFEQVSDKKYFYETFHWLIMSNSKEYILSVFNSVKLNINSDVNLAVSDGNNNYAIYDVYNPASEHGGKLVVTLSGYYNKSVGYRTRLQGNKYWLRKNMTGVTFKSAVVIPELDKPLQEYLADDENRQVNSMHRFQSVCINHCKDLFNFSLRIERTNSWGYIQSDGHFDGLVRLLERKYVDFGSSPLIFKLDRMPVIDYGYGNWILRSTFIYRRPKVIAKSYEIFLRPLEKSVWISISLVMTIVLVALKVTFRNELKVRHNRQDNVDSSWSFLILFTLGAFCQQGATCFPKLFSSRILSVFVYLFCILIYQFYSASIVSYLLMDPPRTINNLGDLVKSPLHVGIEDILIDRNYFVQTIDPDAIKLYETKIKGISNDSGFYSPSKGLEIVKKGGFAFHVETSTAYPIIEETFSNEQICELEEVQMYRTQPMHTNLQKNSPFREMLNFCMFKMAENGNIDRLRKHWDARKPNCIEAAKKIQIHVTIKEFSCGLIALSYGICFAMIFLAMEIIVYHRNIVYSFYRKFTTVTHTFPYTD